MKLKITRREFLTLAGTTTASLLLSSCAGPAVIPIWKKAQQRKVKYEQQVTTICPYCGVGCGAIVIRDKAKKIVSVEGDPDHPINEGSLCSKGSALYQLHFEVTREGHEKPNKNRLTHPLYRAPGSSKWKKISWDEALDKIAQRIKATRDKHFITKDKKGRVVNRLEAIANLGGAALDNEECYLLSKLTRSLGIVYLEHQARI